MTDEPIQTISTDNIPSNYKYTTEESSKIRGQLLNASSVSLKKSVTNTFK